MLGYRVDMFDRDPVIGVKATVTTGIWKPIILLDPNEFGGGFVIAPHGCLGQRWIKTKS